MELEEAKDICKNKICNDVISDYCQMENQYCKSLCENSDCYLTQAIDIVLQTLENKDTKINKVLDIISEYGQIDGAHHKTWVIDQIVRILQEDNYEKWVYNYEHDKETGETYSWDIGIEP